MLNKIYKKYTLKNSYGIRKLALGVFSVSLGMTAVNLIQEDQLFNIGTIAHAQENDFKEVDKSKYTVESNIDVKGELTPGENNNFRNHDVNLKIKGEKFKANDKISFTGENLNLNNLNNKKIIFKDKEIGEIKVTHYVHSLSSMAGNLSLEEKEKINDKSFKTVFEIRFNKNVEEFKNVEIDITNRDQESFAYSDHDYDVTRVLKDSTGTVVGQPINGLNKAFEARKNHKDGNYSDFDKQRFGMSRLSYNKNSNDVRLSLQFNNIYYDNTENIYKKNTEITFNLEDTEAYKIDLRESLSSADGQKIQVGKKYKQKINNTFIPVAGKYETKTKNGFYYKTDSYLNYEVLEVNKNTIKIKLLSDLVNTGNDHFGFIHIPTNGIQLKEISAKTVDPKTGELLNKNRPEVKIELNSPTIGKYNYTQKHDYGSVGTWVTPKGEFVPRYIKTIEAKTPSGEKITVKKSSALKSGEKEKIKLTPVKDNKGYEYLPKLPDIEVVGGNQDGVEVEYVEKEKTYKENPNLEKGKRKEDDNDKSIVYIGTKPSVKKETIPFKEIVEKNNSLSKGTVKVKQEGKNGEKITTTTYIVNPKTGEITEKTDVKTTKAVDKIVESGTKITTIYKGNLNMEVGIQKVISDGEKDGNKIVEKGTKTKIKKDIIAFVEKTEHNASLSKGTVKVKQEGKNGEKVTTTTYTVNPKTGEITEKTDVKTTKAVDKIVESGTKITTTYKGDPNMEVGTQKVISDGEKDGNRIIEKGTKTKIKKDVIPFIEKTEHNPSLSKGTTKVKQEGKNGEKVTTTTYEVNPTTGNIVEKTDVKTTNPVDKIVESGTKITTTYKGNPNMEVGTQKVISDGEKDGNKVIEVGIKQKVEEKEIPSPVKYEADYTKEKGLPNTTIQGKSGKSVLTTKYEVDANTGKVKEIKGLPIITEPTETIIKVPAKQKVETIKDGTKRIKKTTIYSVDPKTGKIKEDVKEELISDTGGQPPVVNKEELKVATLKDTEGNILDVIKAEDKPSEFIKDGLYKYTGKQEKDKDGNIVYIYEKVKKQLPPLDKKEEKLPDLDKKETKALPPLENTHKEEAPIVKSKELPKTSSTETSGLAMMGAVGLGLAVAMKRRKNNN